MEIEKTRIHEFLHHEKIDKHLTRLETVTKMKRETLFSLLLIVLGVLLLLSYSLPILCSLAGLVYPAICSVKSIRDKDGRESHWLKFWLVVAALSLLDPLNAIPYFPILKSAFLFYAALPSSKAAEKIFTGYVEPAIQIAEAHALPYMPAALIPKPPSPPTSAEHRD